MWEWGRTVAEQAAAAAWTSWQTEQPQPTVVDPEFWAEASEGESDCADNSAMAAPIREYDLVG
ncbi:hypothetical protein ACFQZZ_30100 [Nocardia sp. GCM10030253]|uniref:hypothetical protein n=1 Tax=Nocardia sp. GCM10030253 TaxID=3273404 RepID=UPI003640EDC7